MKETRITDPETGGQKGSKIAQLGALDPNALLDVASVAGFGADKYEVFNFTKGYRWSLSYNAMQRHLLAWHSGEDNDPESGLPHLAHAAWHCLTLLTFGRFKRGTDDRFPLRAVVPSPPDAFVTPDIPAHRCNAVRDRRRCELAVNHDGAHRVYRDGNGDHDSW